MKKKPTTKKPRLRCSSCGRPIPYSAHKTKKRCALCLEGANATASRFERAEAVRINKVLRAQDEGHDPTVEHVCRLCVGPWEGSHDAGFYCPTCKATRRLEVLDDIERRESKRKMERRTQRAA